MTGGRIDHAHHDTKARLALDETVEFAKAVQTAAELTDEKNTLIVVTADHAHTMSFSGYPARGNDILREYGENTQRRISAEITQRSIANRRQNNSQATGYRLQAAGCRTLQV
jgi:alkaline phosphatase